MQIQKLAKSIKLEEAVGQSDGDNKKSQDQEKSDGESESSAPSDVEDVSMV